jgi:filamentous hemagglutinin family protein
MAKLTFKLSKTVAVSLLIGSLIFPGPIFALPQDGNIVSGGGSITSPSSGEMVIQQNTNKLIADWQSFSIGSGESVQFIQPGSSSIALNRVIGQDPSVILGNLSSNGQVFLTNPSGVIFGTGAQVNVHGLIATTLSISNEDFINGNYYFVQDPNRPLASVTNEGAIQTSGYVGLLAPAVVNTGTINARLGSIALASGTAASLDFAGDGMINFTLTGETAESVEDIYGNVLGDRVNNSGLLQANGGTVTLTGKNASDAVQHVINQEGVIKAKSIVNKNGRVFLGGEGGSVNLSGTVDVSGDHAGESGGEINVVAERVYVNSDSKLNANGQADGGAITILAGSVLNAGAITADGSEGNGGSVDILFTGDYIAVRDSLISASSQYGYGGDVTVSGGSTGSLFTSGSHLATGYLQGGVIELTGDMVTLVAATADASGTFGGGAIYVGGDFQGQGDLPLSSETLVSAGTVLKADANVWGDGGEIVIWSEGTTRFFGETYARGGDWSGDGGSIEISGKGGLAANGVTDAGAPNGKNGTLLMDPQFFIVDDALGQFPSIDLIDPNQNETGWGFGIVALTNGNLVVTDPTDNFGGINNAGAAYLYDGKTGALISSLTGSTAGDSVGSDFFMALSNGNYVVKSNVWNNGSATRAGAVTWGSGTAGVSGIVSSTNSLVGSIENDQVGNNNVTALSNGNYVVASQAWDNGTVVNAGAATWGNGSTGITGVVSSTNSLVGSTANANVGDVTALSNGNYVVRSTNWSNGTVAIEAGAVTWGDGSTGITGVVSSANSLVGSTSGDRLGSSGVIALSNGHYVVSSERWDNGTVEDAGAVTWGNGSTGITGVVSSTNSLVGSHTGDEVGGGIHKNIVELSNGNYVIVSRYWNNPTAGNNAGAVTWANGTGPTSGVVSSANSMVGSTFEDQVGSGGITVLNNGNYVIASAQWDNGTATNTGAATWVSGTGPTGGVVSSANSLVGSTKNDGDGGSVVTALSNGNYVVTSHRWDNGSIVDAGAVTWGSGTVGVMGVVSSANSLIGSSADDKVGFDRVTALSNGNYVVASSFWANGTVAQDVGAVTWVSGTGPTSGFVSSANSLVGSSPNDKVGSGRVTALSNGNYVVASPFWNNGTATSAGAATWGNGSTGIIGVVSSTNSLVGSTANDQVGSGGIGGEKITALPNGNYVVNSHKWDNGTVEDAGAVTWGSGTVGVMGVVSSANSLVGSTANDQVGNLGITTGGSVLVLSNGNYLVKSTVWDNGTVIDAGAVTWGSGTSGVTGPVNGENSVMGRIAGAGLDPQSRLKLDLEDNTAYSNTVAVLFSNGGTGTGRIALMLGDPSDIYSSGFLTLASGTVTVTSAFIERTLNTGTDVTLQANSDVIINSPIDVINPSGDGGELIIQAGRSVLINAGIATDNGNLTIVANETLSNGVVDAYRLAGDAVITMAGGTIIDAGTGMVDLLLSDGAGVTEQGSGDVTLNDMVALSIKALNMGPGSGDVILNGTLTASGAGDSIILAAVSGGIFINNAGAGALVSESGRWLIYSATPLVDRLGGLIPDAVGSFTLYPTIPSEFLVTDNGVIYSGAEPPHAVPLLTHPGILSLLAISSKDGSPLFTLQNNSSGGVFIVGPGGGGPIRYINENQGWIDGHGWGSPWSLFPDDLINEDF